MASSCSWSELAQSTAAPRAAACTDLLEHLLAGARRRRPASARRAGSAAAPAAATWRAAPSAGCRRSARRTADAGRADERRSARRGSAARWRAIRVPLSHQRIEHFVQHRQAEIVHHVEHARPRPRCGRRGPARIRPRSPWAASCAQARARRRRASACRLPRGLGAADRVEDLVVARADEPGEAEHLALAGQSSETSRAIPADEPPDSPPRRRGSPVAARGGARSARRDVPTIISTIVVLARRPWSRWCRRRGRRAAPSRGR